MKKTPDQFKKSIFYTVKINIKSIVFKVVLFNVSSQYLNQSGGNSLAVRPVVRDSAFSLSQLDNLVPDQGTKILQTKQHGQKPNKRILCIIFASYFSSSVAFVSRLFYLTLCGRQNNASTPQSPKPADILFYVAKWTSHM